MGKVEILGKKNPSGTSQGLKITITSSQVQKNPIAHSPSGTQVCTAEANIVVCQKYLVLLVMAVAQNRLM